MVIVLRMASLLQANFLATIILSFVGFVLCHKSSFLNHEELGNYIGKEDKYIDYHISQPQEIGAPSRRRRSTTATEDATQTNEQHLVNARQFEIHAFDTTYHVVVEPAQGLVKEGLEAEFVGSDGKVTHRELIDTGCLYQGKLVFPQKFHGGNTNVALGICNGLTGVVSTPDYDLVIKPLHEDHAQRYRRESRMEDSEGDSPFGRNDAGSLSSERLHIVIKRDAQYPDDFDLGSGDVTADRGADTDMQEHFCGLDSRYFETIFNHTTPIQSQERAGYTGRRRRDAGRNRRETDEVKAMELLVVADNQMRLFYGSDVVNYTLIVMNIAAGRFQHQSLGRGLFFHIVKLVIMTADSVTTQEGATLNSVPDGELTLASFCSYQYHTNHLQDDHPDHWDNAVLITRHDIELKQNKYLLGIANLRGACSDTHQCSVNEDNGPSSGLIIAHEIGHTVGMLHDADTGCPAGANIMSSSRIGGSGSYLWSECSREQFDAFLRYPTVTCLNDIPEVLSGFEGERLPGEIYDADEQCLQYSEYFSGACTDTALPIYGVQDRCPQMFCRFPNGLCSRTGVAIADGTTCGENKWCFGGTCVDRPNTPIDGGWSPWDATWGPCSRTCGGGVELRHRYCNDPEPRNGGESCKGQSIVANMCNVQPCETTQREFRNEQCTSSSREPYDGLADLTWTSTTDNQSGDQLCELWCQADLASATGETVRVLDRRDGGYMDGTRCSLDYNEMRVCVQGTCREFGCDGYQYSGVRFDECRVCGGNGSTCRSVDGSLQLNLSEQQFSTFLTIPKGVTSFSAVNTNTSTFMDVMINGELVIGGSSQTRPPRWEYWFENITVYYQLSQGQEVILIAGPTLHPIEIQAFAASSLGIASANIHYVYYVSDSVVNPTPTPTPVTHIWAKSGGECSVTCGDGTRMEVVRCVDVVGVQFVNDALCDVNSRPVPHVESCREDDCPPRWFLADLNTTCSATCGEGVRSRVVVCLLFAVEGVRVVDDSFCDGAEKPNAAEPCTDLPDCPGTWVMSSWSECKPCASRTRLALCRTGSDFLTQLDDEECPEPKPHTSEPCECVTTTPLTIESSSHPVEYNVTGTTAQPGGVSEPPAIRPDDNFLTHDRGTIKKLGSTDGSLSSIVVVAPLGYVVLVYFEVVTIDCSLGELFRVKDEENVYSACNSFTNFNWTSTGSILQFDLITTADDRGYTLSYRFIPVSIPISDCDQVFLEDAGTLSSPNYPSDYPNDQQCVYHIVAPPNVRINLYFDHFDLQLEDALLCSTTRDHILIKDLDQRFYSSIYCGQHVPFGYVSSGNRLRINFFSNSNLSSLGFSATYNFVE
ncbi:A disintegrin and metalloproteinase with thrombospondin motifs 13-like [Lytechinus pictus]|uniref:A disintegrin and metalloproteinase with thrombospondin motifs 13-like n=1 Tax=Lytechinus pictus TaxID=7653 RepID=UPI0030B9F544